MNFALFAAVGSALIGVAPLLFKKRFAEAAIEGVLGFLLLWWVYYAGLPSPVYPLLGVYGFCIACMWTVSAIVDGNIEYKVTGLTFFPVAYVVLVLVVSIYGWSAFHAHTYASMIGTIQEREWTKDVQPKDPHHIRLVDEENALYTAKKAIANAGAVGSQFQIESDYMTLQRVREHLVFAVPLDFNGYPSWLNTEGSPGFFILNAEDPETPPRFIALPKGKEMHYSPGAYFGNNLKRHLRNNGYLADVFATFRFELDDDERPYWVVTTYQPTISWYGEKITGVLTVDPVTGKIAQYTTRNVPAWVDRVVPKDFVKKYAEWNGSLTGGWWNSVWSRSNLTEPENPILIYGSDNRAEWVTGVTSKSSTDDSLIGLMYADSRTGEVAFYRTNGGGTDRAIIQAVNNNQQVKFRHLHATTPQIYNIYGTMAAVVPLLNENHAFQGVSFVAVANVQDVAVGSTLMEALRNYQALVFRKGQQVTVERTQTMQKLSGTVDRIRQDVGQNGNIYYFHVAGTGRIFLASSQEFVKLVLTQSGDTVQLEYVASDEKVVPIQSFENLSLPLEGDGETVTKR